MQNGVPELHSVRTPSTEQLQTLLDQIIKRIMKALIRHGALIEEEGMTYLADIESDAALAPLQSAACTYRITGSPGRKTSADVENRAHTKQTTTSAKPGVLC